MVTPQTRFACRGALAAAVALGVFESAFAQSSTQRVSTAPGGADPTAASSVPAVSGDGRFVAFASQASNLVNGDTNSVADVFVRDMLLGTTTRVSVSSSGAQASAPSDTPSISADGRFVAFQSSAANLVLNDTNGWPDIFVHDTWNGSTIRANVSSTGVQANGGASSLARLSPLGDLVAFISGATNLVPADLNSQNDAFVHNMLSGSTIRVSTSSSGVSANAPTWQVDLANNGSLVVFSSSASNLVPSDTNGAQDVFIRNVTAGTTSRVSVDSGGAQANGQSGLGGISSDGRFVVFVSNATNLVALDSNSATDVFLHQPDTASTILVSRTPTGAVGAHASRSPRISADGRFVVFVSAADDLINSDMNGVEDVFLFDRVTASIDRISVDSAGMEANAGPPPFVETTGLAADGRFVAFTSDASNLVPNDMNGVADIFIRDRGPLPPVSFCESPCPCNNLGLPGRGCDNSIGTGGARLSANGVASLSADSLVLTSSFERPSSLTVFIDGTDMDAPVFVGDGLRCVGGAVHRLFSKTAVSGGASAPEPQDPTLSARAANIGAPIPLGASRFYQAIYRDVNPAFCVVAGHFNLSNGLIVVWGP